MKFVKKVKFLNNGIHTNKYYFLGIRYLKKIWSDSFNETYLFKIKISSHYNQSESTKQQTYLSDLVKYIKINETRTFHSENVKSATVIIPVYNGVEHLEKLIPSLIKNTPEYVKIIIIDDGSPDTKTIEFLEKLKQDNRFSIYRNEQNLGFVKSTNKAMSLVETRYAVWLNSDTVVPEFWLERLLSQFNEQDKIATITPFTNSGVTFSFPDFGQDNQLPMSFEKIDTSFQKIQSDISKNCTYSGTGFCMAIDMKCWNDVGELDYDAFGKGYGEENDWCFRAGRKGYKHLLAPNLFVWHRHGGTFLTEEKQRLCESHQNILKERYSEEMNNVVPAFFTNDPWKNYRNIAALLCCNKNPVLIIDLKNIASDKSGAIDYRFNMIKELENNGHDVIMLEYTRNSINKWVVTPISVSNNINVKLKDLSDIKILFNILNIKNIIINNFAMLNSIESTIDILYEIKQQYNPKITYKFHDYLSVCPSFFLLNNKCENCELFYKTDKCTECLKKNPFKTLERFDITQWRTLWRKLFSCIDEFHMFSEYTFNKIKQVYPSITEKIIIKEHSPLFSDNYTKYIRPNIDGKINIAFVGGFYQEKGALHFIELAKNNKNSNLKFYIIGIDNTALSHDNIKYICGYQRDELGKILTENNIHAVVYCSINNETFSYLAQELMILKVPFICFNNGAHADRIKKYKYNLAEIADDISAKSLQTALDTLIKKVYKI